MNGDTENGAVFDSTSVCPSGCAWATIVAAELVVSLAGFGFLIMNGYRNLESNIVFCGMLAVSMVGFLMNMAFVRISRRVVPWAAEKK
jgi:ABC-type nitrate/sulfonate/bicarbonate transport system permease component